MASKLRYHTEWSTIIIVRDAVKIVEIQQMPKWCCKSIILMKILETIPWKI